MTLEITLLGRPQITLDGRFVAEINANKALGLFYYLAATGQPHSRLALAGLLWSDLPDEAARRNLRVELNRLVPHFDAYLLRDRETIGFNRDLPHRIDLTVFDTVLRHPDPTPEQLRTAIDLYRGDFLDDFYVRDAGLFEEWQQAERERLRQAVQRLTLRLVKQYTQNKEYDAAIAYAQRLLTREPWHEEGHQQLMLLYARTGQRHAVLAQYELCAKALEDEFGVPPADETNILYDRILAGEVGPDSEMGGAPSVGLTPPQPLAPPFQAPATLLHFVGRDNELAALREVIFQVGDAAVFAVVGMGGAGKSTFATHLAHLLRSDFPDGVLWANVATSDPLDVLSTWARALGYDFSTLSDLENRAAALRGVLAEKRTLLVLDDVRSVARTRPLLVGGAQSVTVLTTRDLDVATALNARIHRLDELTPAASLRLLTRILGEERVDAERTAAQTICELLRHLPLAVEITAQRLVSRPRRRLADMADRLRLVEERLELAISDRAVRTSFQVSWEALDANLRRIFALLGVFEGRSFEVAAIAHIAGLDRYTAEDRLFSLTALSLVGEEAESRYRQHPLLADFAHEQLGENTIPFVDVALYYQQFAEHNRTNYPVLRPEWENLMAGMEMAHRLQQWPLVLAYADSLTQAWFTRARYAQARRGYAWASEAAQFLADEHARAVALHRCGQAAVEQNDYAEAHRFLSESLRIFQRLEDAEGIAHAQYYLGRIAIEQGQYQEAKLLLVSSQQLYEQLENQTGVAAAIYQQALWAYYSNDFERSKTLSERALVMQESSNDRAGMAPTLRLLGDIALEQKDYQVAEAYLKRCLSLCHSLQDRGELAAAYYGLAVVARFQGEYELANTHVTHALELCEWMGNRRFQAAVLYEQCRLYTIRHEYELALKVGAQSLTLFRDLQDNFNLVNVLGHLGSIYYDSGQVAEARQLWQEAKAIADSQNHPLAGQLNQRLARAPA
jgi:DNA-binding SARP family transcriptional activator/tetratricopeptide (TPR) repeat protein